jgi:C4-dicarboxylate-specific signal transduction histidine kinase
VRVVAVRDVTERERTLGLLRESEARLRDLAEAAFDVTVLSREGVIVDISGKHEQLFGYQKHEIVGRPVLDFVAPSAVAHTERAITEGHTGVYQTTLMSLMNEPIAVEVVGVTSTLGGIPTRFAGLRDLRASLRMDAERRELERQVERSQRLDSLGVLAGGVAHDFNNLLVGILGNADLLLSETRDEETTELLAAIVSAAQQAAGLTAGLLAYAGRGEAMTERRTWPSHRCNDAWAVGELKLRVTDEEALTALTRRKSAGGIVLRGCGAPARS